MGLRLLLLLLVGSLTFAGSFSLQAQDISALQRRLGASEAAHGADSRDTIVARRALATALIAAGRLDDARPIAEQALSDARRVLGDDIDRALVEITFGDLIRRGPKPLQAIGYYQTALRITQRRLRAPDIVIGTISLELGELYSIDHVSDPVINAVIESDARGSLGQASWTFEELGLQDYQPNGRATELLAANHLALGDVVAARAEFAAALKIAEIVRDPTMMVRMKTSLVTATTTVPRTSAKEADARANLHKAEATGDTGVVGLAITELASQLCLLARNSETVPLLQRALTLAVTDFQRIQLHWRLAKAFYVGQRWREAEQELRAGIDIPRSDPDTVLTAARMMVDLAALLRITGRFGEAEQMSLRALSTFEAEPKAAPSAWQAIQMLGTVYEGQNRLSEARDQLARADAARITARQSPLPPYSIQNLSCNPLQIHP